jgi:hypothetical protein
MFHRRRWLFIRISGNKRTNHLRALDPSASVIVENNKAKCRKSLIKMKLLFVEIARSMWAFNPQLLSASGLSLQEVFKKLNERYNFAKPPQHPLDVDPKTSALMFQLGTFTNSAKRPVNVTLGIFNNGITGETSSTTDDATEFLQDLTAWMTKEFGFQLPSKVEKGYLSQITVELAVPSLAPINPKLQVISGMLSANTNTLDGKSRQFEVGALNFWSEDVGAQLAPAPFRLERKWGVPFASNQYFSIAPLETELHLNVVNELEKILKS